MTAVPIHTVVTTQSSSTPPSYAGPATPHPPGSPQANPGDPSHQQLQQDSLEDIRGDLDHYPGGLSESDPADQQALADAVPHNPDGTPERFPDPFGSWAQLQNDGGNTVPGRSNNCADCSRSFLETWYGNPQVSAPRTLDTNEHGNPDPWSPEDNANENQIRWTGAAHAYAGPGSDPETANNIASVLQQSGPGSAAIVQVDWPGGGGHAFNVVNHDGNIVWIDTQSGEVSDEPLHLGNAEHVWHIPLDADRNPIDLTQSDADGSESQNDESQNQNDDESQPENNQNPQADPATPDASNNADPSQPSTADPRTTDPRTSDPRRDIPTQKKPETNERPDGQRPNTLPRPDQTRPDHVDDPRSQTPDKDQSQTPDKDRSETPDQTRPDDPNQSPADDRRDRPSDMSKDSAVPSRERLPDGKNADAASYVKDSTRGKDPLYGPIAGETNTGNARPDSDVTTPPRGPAEPAARNNEDGKAFIRRMVDFANESRKNRELYWRKDGQRRNLDDRVDGQELPQLKQDPDHPDDEDKFIAVSDVPPPVQPDYMPEDIQKPVGRGRERISPEHLAELDDITNNREFTLTADRITEAERLQVKEDHGEDSEEYARTRPPYADTHSAVRDVGEQHGEYSALHHAMASEHPEFTLVDIPRTGNGVTVQDPPPG